MLKVELSTTMLIIISVVILALILVCIVFIIYKDKKIDKAEIDDLLDDLSKAKPRENLINAKIEVPIGENLPNKIVDKDEKLDLDSVLNKMQENLNKKEQVVENFENEQEEKSIISYQEWIESMKNDNFKKDIIKYEEEQEKTSKEKVKEFLVSNESEKEFLIKDKEKKFQNTDFISPVFGKMENTSEYPTVKLFDSKKEKKIYKHASNSDNNEFLKSLKEFRSNL